MSGSPLAPNTGSISLDKGVTDVTLAAAWTATSRGWSGVVGRALRRAGSDLDAIAYFIAGNEPIAMAGLESTNPFGNNAATTTGDNQTGHADGDDESINIKLDQLAPDINQVVFLVAAYKKGSSFSAAAEIAFKIYDTSNSGKRVLSVTGPSLATHGNGCVVAVIDRNPDNSWTVRRVNHMGKFKQGDPVEMAKFAIEHRS